MNRSDSGARMRERCHAHRQESLPTDRIPWIPAVFHGYRQYSMPTDRIPCLPIVHSRMRIGEFDVPRFRELSCDGPEWLRAECPISPDDVWSSLSGEHGCDAVWLLVTGEIRHLESQDRRRQGSLGRQQTSRRWKILGRSVRRGDLRRTSDTARTHSLARSCSPRR